MSELKAHRIDNIISAYKIGKAFCMKTEEEVYLKSEADKVIAHNKYKRCLAMAKWCGNAYDKWMMKKAKAIGLGKDGVEYYHQARWEVSHYMRWHARWIKIAEKFKEAK